MFRPANRLLLDRWISDQAAALTGLIVNVGSGTDVRTFGRRTVSVDAFAPNPTVRADLSVCLPFRDNVFDGAVCTEVLEHVPDARHLLREIARVLKTDGRVVVSTPFAFHYHPDPSDFLRYTPEGLRAEAERAGLDVELLSGLGGKLVTMLLLLEGTSAVSKAIARLVAIAAMPLLTLRAPRHDGWSDWAANSVAVMRKRS